VLANNFAVMENDFMQRGYLLPPGCKDLIDALNLQPGSRPQPGQKPEYFLSKLPTEQSGPTTGNKPLKAWFAGPPKPAPPLPPIKGELIISAPMTVLQLAEMLGQKPYLVVADLMKLGLFASVTQVLPFETISRIARRYGFAARKGY
jgi:hypothetical protein